jgi:hypothetical protein
LSEDLLTGLGLDRYFNYKKDILLKKCRSDKIKENAKLDELKMCYLKIEEKFGGKKWDDLPKTFEQR